MNPFRYYLRWRHSKGFGIHSPYAYRFIMTVLRPGIYHFYSYWEIDKLLKGKEKVDYNFIKLIRFTIRLAIFLKSKRLIGYNDSTRLTEVTAAALNRYWLVNHPKENFTFQEDDLLIIEKDLPDISILHRALERGVPVFALNPSKEIRRILETPISHGVFFYDKDRMILIPRQEMVYVAYFVNLTPQGYHHYRV